MYCWRLWYRHFSVAPLPETIVQSYDTLSLPDVYAVLAYCLTHREEIDEYMRRCDAEAVDVRRRRRGDAKGPARRARTTYAAGEGRSDCSGC